MMTEDALIARMFAIHHDRGWRLDFPPATEAQVAATERALGFALPLLLRRLYMEVGNGGFGPCRAFLAVHGGYADEDIGKALTLADVYAVFHDPKDTVLPHGVVPVLNWGCARRSCVGCTIPEAPVHLFVGHCGQPLPEASTLADWLAAWGRDPEHFAR
jgi:hypothetical protein